MKLRALSKLLWETATGYRYSTALAVLLWLADLALSSLVLLNISYTEIDWEAYMQQVALVLKGERDYKNIKGGTGPIVYPAGHVYIYSVLYKLTDNGQNIFRAQIIFQGLYMITLALVFRSYVKAKAPLYSFPLVILSKRLHSIYILRLFNDGFVTLISYLAISLWQGQYWLMGSLVYSAAIGVKMNALLYLPAVGIILLQSLGPKIFRAFLYMLQVQIFIAYPFSSKFFLSYVTRAFQFNRVFIYKWTVNWRFIDETVFLSPEFAQTLLVIQGVLLAWFMFTRWIKPSNMNLVGIIQTILFPTPRPLAIQRTILANMSPEYILKTMYTCNLIGVFCARSLHYQFYSWFAWSLPYLLSTTGWNPILQYIVWALEEWSWNVFPSTKLSSMIVVLTNAAIIAGVWFGTAKDVLAQAGPNSAPDLAAIHVKESPTITPAGSASSSPPTGSGSSAAWKTSGSAKSLAKRRKASASR
ncbi:ALG3 protein-domain-containing protein [Limtongia smithiae]|uniref:ALG3 protein-domain-containing protein n=1 Tax=Limtongia smithiae TaxID=1125753 RepID=UPI0034CF1EBA